MVPARELGGRSRGFSLVELVVVLAIVAILAGMAIPEFTGSHQGALVRAAGREVVALVGAARSEAVARGWPRLLYVDVARRRLWIDGPPQEPWDGAPETPRIAALPPVELDQRLRLLLRRPPAGADDAGAVDAGTVVPSHSGGGDSASSPLDAVTFLPDGSADAAQVVVIDAQGRGVMVEIEPLTARARIAAFEGEGKP